MQAARKIVNRAPPAITPAAAVQTAVNPGRVQCLGNLKVSSPADPAEREAERVARQIVHMPTPRPDTAGPSLSRPGGHPLARLADGPGVAAPVSTGINAGQSSGSPLPPSVRRFMEPRFRTDFGAVRIHTGEPAARMSRQLNAQAFTVGNQIFFGRGRFQPDSHNGRELIAHELTHTIQQGSAIQRSPEPMVSERSTPQVQRLDLSLPNPLTWIADKASEIPGFRMFTIVLGVNPVNMSSVDRSAANIMRAIVEFIPGGTHITEALDNHGIFDRIANWVSQQIDSLGMIGSSIKQAIDQFIDSLSLKDLANLGGLWERAKRIVTVPIEQIKSFARGLLDGIVTLVKDAILRPIGKLAQGTSGYKLLCAVLGKDPITGDDVASDAESLMGAFMTFIGQGDVWAKMQSAKAVPRAFLWFKNAVNELKGFVGEIPGLFVTAFKSLVLMDIVLLPRAFAKLAGVFGGFAGRFISWGANAVWKLLEIIFDVISPGAFGYVKQTGAALKSILKNPLPFVGNLVRAAKLGFQNFAGNFLGHLKAGLIEWLTGSLPGVYIPKAFSLGEIVKFVFSVLGLTWANVRGKLVKVVGETAVTAMETGFDIVVTLVRQGPAAAWDKIKDQLANLKDTVIGGITDLVVDAVVKKAVPKLIAMFIPGAGFISAILSIYDTVMVFVSKLAKIAQVISAFVSSIVSIAKGAIGAAAGKVESTLAGLLSLAISFLAGFAGLGRISDKIMGVIQKIRAPIDKALDSLITWIVAMARKLGRFVAQAGVPNDPRERLRLASASAVAISKRLSGRVTKGMLDTALAAVKTRYGLTSLETFQQQGSWKARAHINPKLDFDLPISTDDTKLTAQELTDMLVGQASPIEEPAEEAASPISASSLSYCQNVLLKYIELSPATAARKSSARGAVISKLAEAASTKNSHAAYKALQQAGGIVNSLYPGKRPMLVIHHEQEVAEFKETFLETRRGRIRVSKKLASQVQKSVADTLKKLAPIPGGKTAQKKKAEELTQELIGLIRDQSVDDQRTVREKVLDEIDLIAITERVHIDIHRRRKRSAK